MKRQIKWILKFYEQLENFLTVKKNSVLFYTKYTNLNGKMIIHNEGEFVIDENARINSKYSANPIGGQSFSSFYINKQAKLHIGKGSALSNSTIVCWKKISIAENVFIGGSCKIYDTDFHSVYASDRKKNVDDNIKTAEVKINSNVFIGAFSIILKGVEIGENSVIGAGSVVTKNIPPNEIWAGNPAKKIKTLHKECYNK